MRQFIALVYVFRNGRQKPYAGAWRQVEFSLKCHVKSQAGNGIGEALFVEQMVRHAAYVVVVFFEIPFAEGFEVIHNLNLLISVISYNCLFKVLHRQFSLGAANNTAAQN